MRKYFLFFLIVACKFSLFQSFEIKDKNSLTEDTFRQLLQIFKMTESADCPSAGDSCNYWQLGNAFDTVIDFLRENPKKSEEFFNIALTSYSKTSMKKYKAACWFDDFGWWAVGTARAVKYKEIFPSLTIFDKIDEISRVAYSKLHESSEVWESCTYDDECISKFKDFEPKYRGGVWNYFWTDEVIENLCVTPCDPRNPDNTLCGIQNTVTNGLFAQASTLLMEKIPKCPYYKQSYLQISKFFEFWMKEVDDFSIIKKLNDNAFIFRERVSQFKNGEKQIYFDKDLSWAGDNGILLGYFVSAQKLGVKDYSLTIINLLRGIKAYFVTKEGKFINWARFEGFPGPAPGNDPWDYNTGISVLLRNVRSAYDSDDNIKKVVYELFGDNILKLSDSLQKDDSELCTSSQCGNLARLTNKLQVLTFANRILLDFDKHYSLEVN